MISSVREKITKKDKIANQKKIKHQRIEDYKSFYTQHKYISKSKLYIRCRKIIEGKNVKNRQIWPIKTIF